MKKFLCAVICLMIVMSLMVFPVTANTVTGYTTKSDIVTYINHYPIDSFNVNDYTAIVVEDLREYGFNVEWNGETRTLTVERNSSTDVSGTGWKNVRKMNYNLGKKDRDIYHTDIRTIVKGDKVESFNIGGYTAIYVDELSRFGEVSWVPEIRALKVWMDDFKIKTNLKTPDLEPSPSLTPSTSEVMPSVQQGVGDYAKFSGVPDYGYLYNVKRTGELVLTNSVRYDYVFDDSTATNATAYGIELGMRGFKYLGVNNRGVMMYENDKYAVGVNTLLDCSIFIIER